MDAIINNIHFTFIVSIIFALLIMKFIADKDNNTKKLLLIFTTLIISFYFFIIIVIYLILFLIYFIKNINNELYKIEDALYDSLVILENIFYNRNIYYYIYIITFLIILSFMWLVYSLNFKVIPKFEKLSEDDIMTDNKKYILWFSICLLTIITFILLLLTIIKFLDGTADRNAKIFLIINILCIILYYIIYCFTFNSFIKGKNIKSLLFLLSMLGVYMLFTIIYYSEIIINFKIY